MEDRGNQQRTSASSFKHYGRLPTAIQRKVKTRRRNSPQRIEKMNSPYCILMSLTKQCFEPIHQYVCPIY